VFRFAGRFKLPIKAFWLINIFGPRILSIRSTEHAHLTTSQIMMTGKSIRDTRGNDVEASAESKQLAISIKFHYAETLRSITLQETLQTMAEVWETCNRS
jgi:hypothetical protein